MGRQSWFREHFTDHPLFVAAAKSTRPDEVWANASQDKIRVYCTPCLINDIGAIVLQEEHTREIQRTNETIRLSLFNIPASVAHGWMEARTETMISHLKNCLRHAPDVREAALIQHAQQTGKRHAVEATPRANRTHPPQSILVSPRPVPYYNSNAPITGSSSGRSIIPQQLQQSANYQQYPSGMSDPFTSGMPPPPAPSPPYPLALDLYRAGAPSRASSYSRGYSPATVSERTGSPAESYYSNPTLKRSRTSLSGSHAITRQSSNADIGQNIYWDDNLQYQFEEAIGRLTASAGFPLSWVTNPEFINFCQTFIVGAKVPSRKTLTQRIIPSILVKVRASAHSKVRGQTITLQCDGWSGVNNHHFVAFMATTYTDLLTVRVNDTTTERKTAELLLEQMEDVIRFTQHEWGAIPIAFTTDASGESRKARRLLGLKYPHMVVPDCYAHQINLIVGDYFKVSDSEFLGDAGRANEVISWLRSKTALLGLIREEMTNRKLKPLSVIRPVPTRWTAFYLAYTRLLHLQRPLDNVIEDDARKPVQDRQVIQPAHERGAREKAERMVAILKDPSFWVSLVRITRHLAPLAIAANVTQSAHCRMDEVLMTFGKLTMEFLRLTDPLERTVQRALIASLERRWSKSDQDVFIAAIILNPFHKIQPFRPDRSVVSLGAIHALFSRLWKRFYQTSTLPADFYSDTRNYIYGDKPYEHLQTTCKGLETTAAGEEPKQSPDPVRAYADISVGRLNDPATVQTPIIKLALHVLSICPNSASCERLFSTFGLILTKLRSRLKKTTLLDLAELKMHIRDEYLRTNVKKAVRERQFGSSQPQQTQQTPVAAAGPENPVANTDPPVNDSPDVSMADLEDPDYSTHATLSSSNSSTRALRRITANLTGLTTSETINEDDDHDYEAEGSFHLPIDQLFDFSDAYWATVEQRSAVASLDAEMSFYELLDLDAVGEPDLDPDLDDAVASLFDM